MFTGLIADVGKVVEVLSGATTDLWIRTALGASELTLGESIAVDGACLTVVETSGDTFRVQASPETLARTTLGQRTAGAEVHLERALRLGDRLGGHLVLGHVDAIGWVVTTRAEGAAHFLEISLPSEMAPWVIEKGSITVDGVSLTINSLTPTSFALMLIPETLARTRLAQRAAGAAVNLEGDVIGKYVARLHALRTAAPPPSRITEESIRAAGFLSGAGS